MGQEPTVNEAHQQSTNEGKDKIVTNSPKRRDLAKWSLALGIVSIFLGGQESATRLLAIPVSIAAVICGHTALHRVRHMLFGGKGLAVAGLIIGYLVCFSILSEPILFKMHELARRAVKRNTLEKYLSDQRSSEKAISLPTKQPQQGDTSENGIHNAAKSGDISAVTRLLDSNPTLVNAKDKDGWTPLYLASGAGHRDVAALLIERGATVDAAENIAGATPLQAAAWLGQIDVARLLCDKGANVNARAMNGLTPLISAATQGHTEIVKLLLEKGAEVDGKTDRGGTALYLAAGLGHIEVARILIGKGADVNSKDEQGQTPLHCAALTGDRNVVELLLERGADPSAKSKLGFTPIEVAMKSGHAALADYMRQRVAQQEQKVAKSAVIAHCQNVIVGNQVQCILKEVLKRDPNTDFPYKVGDRIEDFEGTVYPNAEYGEGQILFIPKSGMGERESCAIHDGRILTLNNITVSKLKELIESSNKGMLLH